MFVACVQGAHWHLLKNLLNYVIEFVHCDRKIDVGGAVVHCGFSLVPGFHTEGGPWNSSPPPARNLENEYGYRIAGNFREHKFSRITYEHTGGKNSQFLIS